MTTSAVKNNFLPPGLVSNLQEVLSRKNGQLDQSKNKDESTVPSSSDSLEENPDIDRSKPIIVVTNADGIESPGLTYLVEALVQNGLYNVHVISPQSDKSLSGHSVTLRETVAVTPAEIKGATAYEVSGTPVDCVSLALSGALFSWSKPLLVISGVNRGSCCGHHMLYSGVVAAAREALISGVPSLSISLNWKKDESQESDFKDAVSVCLPLLNAAMKDIEKGNFPKGCLLNIEVPTSPSTNKHLYFFWPLFFSQYAFDYTSMRQGLKLTKQSLWRSTPSWQAISANRHPYAGRFMSNQQSLGMQLAQLGRDASAAGAARRVTTQRKLVEVESVGVAGKSDSKRTVKYFRLEFQDKEQDDVDENLDFRALENGFVAITPLYLSSHIELDAQAAVSDWISSAFQTDV